MTRYRRRGLFQFDRFTLDQVRTAAGIQAAQLQELAQGLDPS